MWILCSESDVYCSFALRLEYLDVFLSLIRAVWYRYSSYSMSVAKHQSLPLMSVAEMVT